MVGLHHTTFDLSKFLLMDSIGFVHLLARPWTHGTLYIRFSSSMNDEFVVPPTL